jgi:hypothetical protein
MACKVWRSIATFEKPLLPWFRSSATVLLDRYAILRLKISTPERRIASANLSKLNICTALAKIQMPAPASLTPVSRSNIRTTQPRCDSAIALVSPPIPAPTTATSLVKFTFLCRTFYSKVTHIKLDVNRTVFEPRSVCSYLFLSPFSCLVGFGPVTGHLLHGDVEAIPDIRLGDPEN